jgi:hypothetical protein
VLSRKKLAQFPGEFADTLLLARNGIAVAKKNLRKTPEQEPNEYNTGKILASEYRFFMLYR